MCNFQWLICCWLRVGLIQHIVQVWSSRRCLHLKWIILSLSLIDWYLRIHLHNLLLHTMSLVVKDFVWWRVNSFVDKIIAFYIYHALVHIISPSQIFIFFTISKSTLYEFNFTLWFWWWLALIWRNSSFIGGIFVDIKRFSWFLKLCCLEANLIQISMMHCCWVGLEIIILIHGWYYLVFVLSFLATFVRILMESSRYQLQTWRWALIILSVEISLVIV